MRCYTHSPLVLLRKARAHATLPRDLRRKKVAFLRQFQFTFPGCGSVYVKRLKYSKICPYKLCKCSSSSNVQKWCAAMEPSYVSTSSSKSIEPIVPSKRRKEDLIAGHSGTSSEEQKHAVACEWCRKKEVLRYVYQLQNNSFIHLQRVYDCWQPCRDSRVKVPGDRGTLSEMRACAWPLIAGTFKACIHGNATVIGVADERWSDGSHNLVPCLLQVRLSARFQPSCCTGNTTWFAGKPNCVDRMSRKLILSLYDTSHRTSRIK